VPTEIPRPTWRGGGNGEFTGGEPSVGEVRLLAVAASAPAARRITLDALDLWGLAKSHGEAAEQLVGELVANAVRHTGGNSLGLTLIRRLGWLRVEVRDPSRALPCLIKADALDETGRGLQLVDELSDRWGADLLQHGKAVWFELRVRDSRR